MQTYHAETVAHDPPVALRGAVSRTASFPATHLPGKVRDRHHGHEHDLRQIHSDVPPDFYDTAIKKNLIQRYWHGRRSAEIVKLASSVNGRLLDVGCHGGTLTEKVVTQATPGQVVGIDISVKSLEYANARRPGFDLAAGDAEVLPFQDETFEAIFCSEVMEHIEDPDKLLSEVKRCLKPDGYAVVMVPAETRLFKVLWFLWTKFGPGKVWDHAHVQDFGGQELDRVVERAGFRVIKDKRFLLGMIRALKLAAA